MLWTHIDYQMNHKLGILGHGQASRLDQERHRSVAWFVQFTPAERWELMLIGNIVIDSLSLYICKFMTWEYMGCIHTSNFIG